MKMKKIVSIIVAVLMLVTMTSTTTAFAATVDNNSTGKITVNGLEQGATATAYKIVDVDYTNGNFSGYTFAVADWMNKNGYSKYANDVTGMGEASAATKEGFYSKLAAAIKAGSVEVQTYTQDQFASVQLGQYLVLAEGGTKIYKPSTVNVIPVLNGEEYAVQDGVVNVKSEDLSVTKKVNGADATTAGLGDTLTYTLESKIPSYPVNSIDTTYAMVDTLSKGLTYTKDSVVVKVGETTLTKDTDYTLVEENQKMAVKFNYENIRNYATETVTVTYKATINDSAVVGTDGNTNTVKLYYTNSPYVDGKFDINNPDNPDTKKHYPTSEDEAKVYTFGVSVLKVDGKDNNTKLDGAIFTLEKKDGDTWTVVKEGLTTGTDGIVKADQLKEGTYRLVETKAPENYNKLTTPVEFTITAAKDNSIPTGAITEAKAEWAAGYYEATIANYKGTTLPSTGGQGTKLFTVIGLSLMVGAVILLIVRKKTSSESK